jgi:spore coat polysaccharide biosynthesis protein SpsF (cytidylyltransferase family)
LKICGKSIIEFMIERLKTISEVSNVILVTGPEEMNSSLVDEAKKLNVDFFCGSQENILDRMYNASLSFKSDNVIRVTADCPLIDPSIIGNGLKIFSKNNIDVLSNVRVRTYPDGFDFEIIKQGALERAWNIKRKEFVDSTTFYEAFLPPTKYLLESNIFSHYDLLNKENLSNIRLTLDYPEDYELISKIAENLYFKNKLFSLSDVITFLSDNEGLLEINKKFVKLDYGIKIEDS